MGLSLRGYPVTVEPTTRCVELQAVRRADGSGDLDPGMPGSWRQLYRKRLSRRQRDLVKARDTAAHFFGDHQDFDRCTFFVGYNSEGVVDSLMVKPDDGGEFQCVLVPEEVTAKAVRRPSVRLVFKDDEDREEFISGLGKETLRKLAQPPVRIDVGE